MTIQLAKLAGLRVAVVLDHAKHGAWLSSHASLRPDVIVDSHDPARAVDILRRATRGQLHAGLDTRGSDSATHLLRAMLAEGEAAPPGDDEPPTPPGTPGSKSSTTPRAHLVGMTGMPKWPASPAYALHAVPVKMFHEVPEVGAPISAWLGRLLDRGLIAPPDILGVGEGLESVNDSLDRMRSGEISAGKLVVRV